MQTKNELLKESLQEMLSYGLMVESSGQERQLGSLSEKESAHAAVNQMAYGLDLLNLLFAYKKAKLKSKGITWECRAIRFKDLPNLLNDLANKTIPSGEKKRIQVVIQGLVHTSNLDIEIRGTKEGNHLSIAILDAVDDQMTYANAIKPSLLQLKEQYPGRIDNVFWTAEAIQYDSLMCLIFSFKIASALRQHNDFHTLMKSLADKDGKVNWSDFPPSFLKLCQSKRFLDAALLKAWHIEYSKITAQYQDSDEIYEKFKALGLSEEALNSVGKLLMEDMARYAAMPSRPLDSWVVNKKGENLMEYYKKHARFKPGDEKAYAGAAQDLFAHYAKDLSTYLLHITPDELEKIVAGEMPFPLDIEKNSKPEQSPIP